MSRKPKILLGVTGSIEASQTPNLVSALKELGEVRVIATEAALFFWNVSDNFDDVIWTDGPKSGTNRTNDCNPPYISLGNWADILVVAPLTANTLTKMALGIADNLLTCTFYAWPTQAISNGNGKPILLAPAMNTRMYMNPMTRKHLDVFRGYPYNVRLIGPVSKRLACGTTDLGAMADIESIRNMAERMCHGLRLD